MELWMLGGDRRSPWTAQTLRAAGHAVHTFCVPSLPDETPPPEIERLILPMPCLRNGAVPGTRPLAPQEVLAHLRAGSRVYGGLLAHSFRRAQACFDAMESRCYDGGIRFLTREKPVRAPHALVCGALTAGMVLALVCGA